MTVGVDGGLKRHAAPWARLVGRVSRWHVGDTEVSAGAIAEATLRPALPRSGRRPTGRRDSPAASIAVDAGAVGWVLTPAVGFAFVTHGIYSWRLGTKLERSWMAQRPSVKVAGRGEPASAKRRAQPDYSPQHGMDTSHLLPRR